MASRPCAGGDGGPRLVAPPGMVAMLLRWRAELLIAGVVALAWRSVGADTLVITALVLLMLVAFVPGVRLGAVQLVRALVVPHRVRMGLVQAGVADLGGRMPWVVAARPIGPSVRVSIWLRAGTTAADVARAAPLIAVACGAVQVDVARRFARADRVTVLVHRPRWGWPGH
jgi:hypothetical protein